MPLSFNTFTGNGTTGPFNISFSYLEEDDIKVFVDGEEVDFSFITSSQIELDEAAPNGAAGLIKRVTDRDALEVTFQDASTSKAADYNLSNSQFLNLIQEIDENSPIDFADTGQATAGDLRIEDLGEPVLPSDAVTKNYVDTVAIGTVAAVIAAEAAQAAAEVAQGLAEAAEDGAEDAQAAAEAAQGLAEDAADAAEAAQTAAENAQAAAEAAASGIRWKNPVVASSVSNVDISSAPSSLDGKSLTSGDGILLQNQSAPAENGVWTFNGTGQPLTRRDDMNSWGELVSAVVAVEEGSTWADYTFICTVNAGGTLGSTAVTWATLKIVLADGQVVTAKIGDAQVTLAKIVNASANSLLGNNTGNGAVPAWISAANIRAMLSLDGGVYTPTLVNGTNVAASTAYPCIYQRNGDIVTVSGRIDVDPTSGSGTDTQVEIPLPIASNLIDGTDVSGVSNSRANTVAGTVTPNTTSDRALMRFPSGGTANEDHWFIFQYRIRT